jgi:hypothetical protein
MGKYNIIFGILKIQLKKGGWEFHRPKGERTRPYSNIPIKIT